MVLNRICEAGWGLLIYNAGAFMDGVAFSPRTASAAWKDYEPMLLMFSYFDIGCSKLLK